MNLNILVKLSLLLTVIVIALGAYTRLSDAGLGCPDWPGCYGQLTVPTKAVDVQAANAAYPERAVEADKAWLEMIHRYFAGTLGLCIFAITAWSIRHKRSEVGVRLPIALSVVVVFQAALGMWTVTLKLMPLVVMGHLLGGFTLLALLSLFYFRLKTERIITQNRYSVSASLKWMSLIALCVVVLQIMLGGWTSSNYAAVVCSSLPICEGNWPALLDFKNAFSLQLNGYDSYEFGVLEYPARMTIHVTHRIGALITFCAVGALALRLYQSESGALSKAAAVLAAVLVAQVCLGIANVVLFLPLSIAVLHNLGAASLLICLTYINYQLWTAQIASTSPHKNSRQENGNKPIGQIRVNPEDKECTL
jgi:cytochrome c oxidase assembly protein subunit 15